MSRILFVAMATLNIFLMAYVFNPNEMSLAGVAASNGKTDSEAFYNELGPFFSGKFRYVEGGGVSILYSKDGEAVYVYNERGPILAYSYNSVEVYPEEAGGSFHDVIPGMLYYDRDINVLSYYSGQQLKIGGLDSFPELILDASKNDSGYGLLYKMEGNGRNETHKLIRNGRECGLLNNDVYYMACCHKDKARNDREITAVEGYLYEPFDLGRSRWRKLKDGFLIEQSDFDKSCEALHPPLAG